MSTHDTVVIVAPTRTPLGGFQGSLSSLSAPELGSAAVKAVLNKSGLAAERVEELVFGCVIPAGLGQSPARQVALGAALPESVTTTTINKVCGSGMKTVMMAYDQIKAGSNAIIVAGGMESMSNAPYLLPKARDGYRLGHAEVLDHLFFDGLQDAGSGKLMGNFAQHAADKLTISREEMDNYALQSLARASKAIADNVFSEEITPISIVDKKGETLVLHDEQPGRAKPEKIPNLKPAFAKDGSITAANSSSISDGAAAMLVMSGEAASESGVNPIAKIVAHSSHAQSPAAFCTAPIPAIEKVLEKAGWHVDDVDLFEINEAFAVVALAAMKSLKIPNDKINIHGGACALGHPLGASGARIVVTLLHALKTTGKQRGIASLCIGGGEATAIAVEML